jgi:hypothetical protein
MVCSALADRPLDFNADVVPHEIRGPKPRNPKEGRNPKSEIPKMIFEILEYRKAEEPA